MLAGDWRFALMSTASGALAARATDSPLERRREDECACLAGLPAAQTDGLAEPWHEPNAACFTSMTSNGLTFDMRDGRQQAELDVGRPLDGRVSCCLQPTLVPFNECRQC